VLGLVALNAMVAQSSFKVDDLDARVEQLQRDVEQKQYTIAQLRAPDRVVSAAEGIGLVLPKPNAVKVIHVEGEVPGRGAPELAPPGDGG